jgi:hypothetical protein
MRCNAPPASLALVVAEEAIRHNRSDLNPNTTDPQTEDLLTGDALSDRKLPWYQSGRLDRAQGRMTSVPAELQMGVYEQIIAGGKE